MQADDIQAFAIANGHNLGWRFLMCPERLIGSAPFALITLNPGGSLEHGTAWSFERGNAYWDESWRGMPPGTADSQKQVQRLAEIAGASKSELLSGYYVPFRSPSWDALPNKRKAEAFAARLWSSILGRATARTIFCVGKAVTARSIASLVNASLTSVISAGWGEQTIDVYKTEDSRKVVALPHLSRFQLMMREKSEEAFRQALAA